MDRSAMRDAHSAIAATGLDLGAVAAPEIGGELRIPTEHDLIQRIKSGYEVEITVPSLTADTGIQGIAIGEIYRSWAINDAPPAQPLSSPEEIRREVIRVEDACRDHIGKLDAGEALSTAQRSRGTLRSANNWDKFVGGFLYQTYISPDVFKNVVLREGEGENAKQSPLFAELDQYRGYSQPVPENLKESVEEHRASLLREGSLAPEELNSSIENFRRETIEKHQAALLKKIREKILPALDTLCVELKQASSQASSSTAGLYSTGSIAADQLFIFYARDVVQLVRQGHGAEWAAFALKSERIEELRSQNLELQGRLEKRELLIREALMRDGNLKRDLDAEYAEHSAIKANLNEIAECVGQRTTLLRLLRGEFLDLRQMDEGAPESVVVVGDLVVNCSLAAIPPARRAGMICSENNGIGHTILTFTSTMKPIAGASEGVLNILKSCPVGTHVVYEGARNLLVVNPTPETVGRYREERDRLLKQIEKPLPVLTPGKGERSVEVLINVRSAQEEVIGALKSMGASVGLYTPESDCKFEARMEQTSVSRQTDNYKDLSTELPQEVTIRAWDFSGDKFNYRKDQNIRGSNFARDHSWTTRDELIAQFTAVLQAGASRHQPFTLLFPNITGPENLKTYFEALDRAFERADRVPASGILGAGVQIESIVGVHKTLDILRSAMRSGRDPQVRLVAIGTNDLGMEVTQREEGHAGDDRTTARVNHYNPELFVHIHSVRQQLDTYNSERRQKQSGFLDIPLEVCGVMASQRLLVPVLRGLGVNKFSVNISNGHDIANTLACFDEQSCVELVERLMVLKNSDQVRNELINFWESRFPGIKFEARRDGELVPLFESAPVAYRA